MQIQRQDSLNTIRLLAALQVVWNHASWHLELSGACTIPVAKFLGFFHGIPIFFTLSGFLIWMSIGRSQSFVQYAKKRFWRIYPELWLGVFVEITTLLVLFKGVVDWPLLGVFAIGQATIFPMWVPAFLRTYGCGTPNGALWSIFALVQFYILAYPMYKLLHRKKAFTWILWILGFVLLSLGYNCFKTFPDKVNSLLGVSFVPTFWMFMLGAFISEYKSTIIPMIIKFWYIPVAMRMVYLFLDVPDIPVFYGFSHTTICFFAALAIAYKFPRFNVATDVSYGVYIYHMTVINAMIAMGFVGGGVAQYCIVVAVTLTFAVLSQKTVGRWAKNFKSKVTH